MKIISQNTEAKLLDIANSSKNSEKSCYVIHFRFSNLSHVYRNDFHIKVALNIIDDTLDESEGLLIKMENYDIFTVYYGNDRELLNKIVFQIRYLFFDDSAVNLANGKENPDFCRIYDLDFQWADFKKLAAKLVADSAKRQFEILEREDKEIPFIKRIDQLESLLEKNRVDRCIRKQPICAIKKEEPPKSIFNEVYINIQHLQEFLSIDLNTDKDKWLFYYLTEKLDEKVIEIISMNPEQYLFRPLSINLNIKTLLNRDFVDFITIANDFGCQILTEINLTDILSDIHSYKKVLELRKKYNFKICIDGLNTETFFFLKREKLSYDLAKLQWNADVKADLATAHGKLLSEAINNCGKNRVVLCRCDDIRAIEYGKELGIGLFQGRYLDKILNPTNNILN